MSKRVLLFNGYACGGAERMTILYAKILQKAGFECKMFVHVKPGTEANIIEFIPENIEWVFIKSRYRYLFFHILNILKKEKCDIVFCSMPGFVKFVVWARYLLNLKLRLIVRCFNMPSKMSKQSKDGAKWFRYVDEIISQTDEMREELINLFKISREKIKTINNPIDKELINERVKESFDFDKDYINYVAVGRIAPQKDYITMIKAIAKARKTKNNIRLYIIGGVEDDNYYSTLQSLILNLNISDSIFFEGFQNNPFKYMKSADALLLSSKFEGLPNVLLEAMYLEKPVVSTRCIPFVQQIIEEGVNGYSVEVEDCDDFAKAMLDVRKLSLVKNTMKRNKTENDIIKLFDEL